MPDDDLARHLDRLFPGPQNNGNQMNVKSGDLFYIDKQKYLPLLPENIRSLVEDIGYTARYYDFPPVHLASVIETFLSVNLESKVLKGYNSSIKQKTGTRGKLVYYALMHVIIEPLVRNAFGVTNEDEDEIALMIVYSHDTKRGDVMKTGSIVIIAADDVVRYDAWIESINDMYVQKKLPEMILDGGRDPRER